MIDRYGNRASAAHHAWLLIFIEPTTRRVAGAGVYPDRSPTMTLARTTAVLHRTDGRTLIDAKRAMFDVLCSTPEWAWVVELMPATQRVELKRHRSHDGRED